METTVVHRTQFQSNKIKRDERIIAKFRSMVGSKTAIYEIIAKEEGVCRATVQQTIQRYEKSRRVAHGRS